MPELKRVPADAAGFKTSRVDESVSQQQEEPLYIFPIPPEFDFLPDTERLEIPLTGGIAIAVSEGVRPRMELGQMDIFINESQAAGLKKGEFDQIDSELKVLKKPVVDTAKEHIGLRGAVLPEVGLVIQINPKHTREVIDPQRFRDELGVLFPGIGIDHLHASFTVSEGLTDKDGNPITAETFEQIIDEGLSARGISPEDQERIVALKREIEIRDWDDVAREIRVGHVSVATLGAKTVWEFRTDAYERTQGSRPSRRTSVKKSSDPAV